jgi:hypothetical protein
MHRKRLMMRQRDSESITIFVGCSVSSTRVNGDQRAIPLLIERLFRRDTETNTRDARTRAGKLRATLRALVVRRVLRLRRVWVALRRQVRRQEGLHPVLREYRVR